MKLGTGIDLGRHGLRALQVSKDAQGFKLMQCHFAERTEGENATAALQKASREAGWKLGSCRVGLTGRDLILRYNKVPPVPDWQLKSLMEFEIQDIASQSGGEISADFNLLSIPTDFSGEDTVLLALAKDQIFVDYLEAQSKGALRLDSFTPNAIALYNAYVKFGNPGKDTVLIANLGADNVDLALVVGVDLYFARNITGGSALLSESISGQFNVGYAKAESLKKELTDLRPSVKPGTQFESRQHEKVTHAVLGAVGQFPSMLQSTLMFCKTQTKVADIKLSRVLLCGGGARLKGLPEYLSSALSVPVSLFDPFEEVDRSALDDAQAASLDQNRYESVIALGLACAAIDPSLYSIEILPAALQKRREFFSKTIYLAAAGLAGVIYLGADFFITRSRSDLAVAEAQGLHKTNEKRKKTDKQTKELLDQIQTLSSRALLLEQKAGIGSALSQALQMVQAELPAELWVSGITVELRAQKDPDLHIGDDAVPIVRVEGRGREGVGSLSQTFQSFTEKLRSRIPGALKQTTSTTKGFSFTLELNFFAPNEERKES